MSVTREYWETYVLSGFLRKFNIRIQIESKDHAVEIPELASEENWKATLLVKVSEACGLCWDPYFFPELKTNKNFFNRKSPIAPMSLLSFSPQIHRMNVALRAKAYLLKTRIQQPVHKSNLVKRTISMFMQALHSYTYDIHALVELGHLYELMGKYDVAIEYYTFSSEIDPNFEKAKERLASLKEGIRELVKS